jgi:hypothetical protein
VTLMTERRWLEPRSFLGDGATIDFTVADLPNLGETIVAHGTLPKTIPAHPSGGPCIPVICGGRIGPAETSWFWQGPDIPVREERPYSSRPTHMARVSGTQPTHCNPNHPLSPL